MIGVVRIWRSDSIDRITRAIGGHEWSTIHCRESKPSAKVISEGLLLNHHADAAVEFSIPFESLAEEEVGFSHEVDVESVGEEALESLFFGAGFGEENEIVDVKSDVEFLSVCCWSRVVGGYAIEKTWIVSAWRQTHVLQDFKLQDACDHVVPVLRITAKAVEGLFQQPEVAFFCIWIALGWTDDDNVILW